MKLSDSDYETYIALQIGRGQRTAPRTRRHGLRREWIYGQMQELGLSWKTMLCVGARDEAELDFFKKRGYEVEGIDLFTSGTIQKCDMSMMLEHEYFKDQRYDVVFSNESIEHCVDLDGFIEGLNVVCSRYFVCMTEKGHEEGIDVTRWDASVHEFMVRGGSFRDKVSKTFDQFDIMKLDDIRKSKLFFILEKK